MTCVNQDAAKVDKNMESVRPKNWTVRSLRSCLRAAPEYGINAAAVPFDDALPTYLRITDISDDHRFRPQPRVSVEHPNTPAFFLNEGDLVFARTGASVGKSYLYGPDDGPLVFAGFLIRVIPNPEDVQPAFLAYCVQSKRYWDWVAAMSSRSSQPGINGQEYGTFQLLLPPSDEQRAIAEALSDVDALLLALEKMIVKKRAIKQAAMQQLLTGRTRLRGFSRKWETKRLGDLAVVTMGQSPTSRFYNIRGEGLPLIQGNADIEGCRTTSRMYTTKASKCCDAGDLLLTVRAPVGAVAISSEEACLGRGVCGLKTWGDSGFLFHALVYAEDRWQTFEQGSTFAAANSEQIEQFRLYVPTEKDEQAAIAAALSDLDAEIASLEQRRDKTRTIKQGMVQHLLTGRTRLSTPE